MSNSDNHGKIEISKALIGCLGVVLAAIIGGVFLLISTGIIQFDFPPSTKVPTQEPTTSPGDDSGDSTPPASIPVSKADLDIILGTGNWFCLDDYQNGIGVRNLPENIRVEDPWEAADKLGQRYNYGETIPATGPATLWLQAPISKDNCPATESNTQASVTQETIDTLLGRGNWYCLNDYDNGIGVRNVPGAFTIEYPWEAADKFGQRYNFGDTVPEDGPATFWLQMSLSRSECP